jgi:hypothetical protein
MPEIFSKSITNLIDFYKGFIEFSPPNVGIFLNLMILVLLVVVYSVLIWKFYRFISKKSPLGLDLAKYSTAEHSFLSRLFAGFLYFTEYILILPFLVFIIFSVFTLLLIILVQNQNVTQVLVISAVIIAAIRMTAYYKENISQELAKMLPFTLLAVSVLNPNTLTQLDYIERILIQIMQIPSFISQIAIYLLFIIILEIILRFFDFIFSLFEIEEVEKEEVEEKVKS